MNATFPPSSEQVLLWHSSPHCPVFLLSAGVNLVLDWNHLIIAVTWTDAAAGVACASDGRVACLTANLTCVSVCDRCAWSMRMHLSCLDFLPSSRHTRREGTLHRQWSDCRRATVTHGIVVSSHLLCVTCSVQVWSTLSSHHKRSFRLFS